MKCIKLSVEKKQNKNNQKHAQRDVAWIRDGLATIKFGDPNEAFKVYQAKKKEGSKIAWKRGLTFEHYDNMKKENIAEKIEKEVNQMAKETGVIVTIEKEEVEI